MSKLGRRKFLSIATSVTGAVGGIFALTPFVSSFQPSKKAKALGAAIKINIEKIAAASGAAIAKPILLGVNFLESALLMLHLSSLSPIALGSSLQDLIQR